MFRYDKAGRSGRTTVCSDLTPRRNLPSLKLNLHHSRRKKRLRLRGFKENVTIDDFGKLNIAIREKSLYAKNAPKSSKLFEI